MDLAAKTNLMMLHYYYSVKKRHEGLARGLAPSRYRCAIWETEDRSQESASPPAGPEWNGGVTSAAAGIGPKEPAFWEG